MSVYLKNRGKILMCRRWLCLFVIPVFCALLLTADASGRVAKPKPVPDINDHNGPTVALSYNSSTPAKNPTASFMYFVPLIAPTGVDMITSPHDQQQAWLTSYDKKITDKTFDVTCEFEMRGKGFFNNILDANDVMAIYLPEMKKGAPLNNGLDYIKFEGEGMGRIDVTGTIDGNTETVTQVDFCFNIRGKKSPVTIGLYSIAPQDGQYKYENKYNEIVARVATLTFKKCQDEPKMGVTVVSVNRATKPNSYIGRVKGVIVNFFLEPPRISKLGNDTMLDFGYALFKEKPSFTFPKAKNVKPNKPATITKLPEQQTADKAL
jgi:hypothetical protein